MQFKDEDGALTGVALKDKSGSLVWVGLTNQKGYRKSLENSHLWVLDGKTGRLLPLEDLVPGLATYARLSGIILEESQVIATAAEVVQGKAKGEEAASTARVAGRPQDPGLSKETLKQGADGSIPVAGGSGLDFSVLSDLEMLIRRRKTELPEGSYTTHLFKAGIDKIRKKTGEEAVELILAKEKPEVVSETADLVYHLLVLLAQWEIPLSEILVELKKR